MVYNGYTNWETWTVALVLDNDQELQREVRHVARKAMDGYEAGKAIRELVEDAVEKAMKKLERDEFSELWREWLWGNTKEVNWHELGNLYSEE